MKSKMNAKQKREAEAQRKRELWAPGKASVASPEMNAVFQTSPRPAVIKAADLPQQSPEEETREFLEYLDRYNGPVRKDEAAR